MRCAFGGNIAPRLQLAALARQHQEVQVSVERGTVRVKLAHEVCGKGQLGGVQIWREMTQMKEERKVER